MQKTIISLCALALTSLIFDGCSWNNTETNSENPAGDSSAAKNSSPQKRAIEDDLISNDSVQSVAYKKYKPCTFYIELPASMELIGMDDYISPDYCNYAVKLDDGFIIMELHSLVRSRFEYNSIPDLYEEALSHSELNILSKNQSSNWFVISGVNQKNSHFIYWKRVLGDHFVSDMYVEFPSNRSPQIKNHIMNISQSFASD